MARALLIVVSLAATSVLLSGCEAFSSPQNTFAPAGEVAEDQKNLFLLVMWPALVIMIGVLFACVFILVKFRARKGDELPVQTHGNNRLEIAWTIAPAVLLAFFIAPTISGIVDFADVPDDSYEIEVTGIQWAWLFKYTDPETGELVSAGAPSEMHVPVDQNIALTLLSPDVIHSFWVPKLAGKQDVVPGRSNRMWLNGNRVGTYRGQCAEFCGTGHPAMDMIAIVHTQEGFDAWLRCEIDNGTDCNEVAEEVDNGVLSDSAPSARADGQED
jgi:cytochrome c oxidase subunit 2